MLRLVGFINLWSDDTETLTVDVGFDIFNVPVLGFHEYWQFVAVALSKTYPDETVNFRSTDPPSFIVKMFEVDSVTPFPSCRFISYED